MMSDYTGHVDSFTRDNLPAAALWPEFRFDLPELQYPERLNCGVELLDAQVTAGRGDNVAIRFEDKTWTYAELLDQVNRIAAVLRDDLGVVPGNRVLLRAPNNPWLLATWLAVAKAGAVVVATMPMLRAVELVKIIAKAHIALALCDHRLVEALEEARASEPMLERIVQFGNGELEGMLAGKDGSFANAETARDDVVLLAFTSGTTGDPKACMHFHRDVLAMADVVARHLLDTQEDDVYCGTPPLAFTFGLGAELVFPFRFGAGVALIETPGPDALLGAVQRHGVTCIFTAPTAYRGMTAMAGDYDLSSLRQCVSAGETLPKPTSDAWAEATGIRIIDGLGATEMIHIFIAAAGDDIVPGATGKPLPGYQACVLDEDNQPLPAGKVGRLAVKGPTGCRYLDDERQSQYVVNGWNVTGDSYLIDEDGYYWFQARADDMIISSGYNIAGPEVEAAILAHETVAECAVVGSPSAERGSIVKAFVVTREGVVGDEALAKQLQDFVKARIAPYKYPRAVEFVTELPKTQTGKLQRFRLRQLEMARAAGGDIS